MNKPRLTILLFILILTTVGCSTSAEPPRYADLTILHTNDLHGHLFPFATQVLGTPESDVGGAARRATLIRDIRAEMKHPVLLLDAGDVFTRGPIADMEGKPDFDVLNAMAYDAMTLGNNEFKGADGERGMQVLSARMKQARFPVLSANVFDKATGKPIACPYIVLERNGIRIGILGLTAPRVASYAQARNLTVTDPIAVAKETVPKLRKKYDFVIALTHIGYALDLELAQSVAGIDVIIGGDSHTWLFQPTLVKWAVPPLAVLSSVEGRPEHETNSWSIGGTLVCQAGEWGKCLGRLDLRLRRDGGSYEVVSYKGQLIPIDSSIKPASDIESIIARYTKPLQAVVGELAKPVLPIVAAVWVAEAMREATGADVGAQPVASVEDGLRAGKVTLLDIRQMFPWPNPVARVTVTGKQLIEYVTQGGIAVSRAQITDGKLHVGGKPVMDDATYTLAIEDFFARESAVLSSAPRTISDHSIRQIVADRIRAMK